MIRVKVPLPFPLRWVNAYLVPEAEGAYTLIDPGLRTEEGIRVWLEVMEELGIPFRDIKRVLLTHYHPDHYGLAGWFQEQSGAEVFLTAQGEKLARALWDEPLTPLSQQLLAVFVRSGFPAADVEAMKEHMASFLPQVSPAPRITPLRTDEPFLLAGRRFEVIETPGHAVGHVCLYEPETRVMFCGDHVLPQITPNVSFIPGFEPNPLKAFLHSLEKMAGLEPIIAYPGHRDPFSGLADRARDIMAHHDERLAKMREKLAERPLTAYELCAAMFGNKLNMHQMRFALSETLAHLIYMETELGWVTRSEEKEFVLYSA